MANEGIKFGIYANQNKVKIFRYLFYFLRSAVLRGFVNTLRLGTLELRHERRFGISTGGMEDGRSSDFYHYQGAGYEVIIRMFNDLVKGREDFHFVDIGCGKGRAVIVAENAGFRRVTGIELYEDLLRSAAENVRKYPMKKEQSQLTLVHVNALEFDYQDEPAVYFMFNPFAEHVLRQVLLRITQATRSETFFIYMNPRFASVFAELGLKKFRVYKTRFDTEAIIYHLPAQA